MPSLSRAKARYHRASLSTISLAVNPLLFNDTEAASAANASLLPTADAQAWSTTA